MRSRRPPGRGAVSCGRPSAARGAEMLDGSPAEVAARIAEIVRERMALMSGVLVVGRDAARRAPRRVARAGRRRPVGQGRGAAGALPVAVIDHDAAAPRAGACRPRASTRCSCHGAGRAVRGARGPARARGADRARAPALVLLGHTIDRSASPRRSPPAAGSASPATSPRSPGTAAGGRGAAPTATSWSPSSSSPARRARC